MTNCNHPDADTAANLSQPLHPSIEPAHTSRQPTHTSLSLPKTALTHTYTRCDLYSPLVSPTSEPFLGSCQQDHTHGDVVMVRPPLAQLDGQQRLERQRRTLSRLAQHRMNDGFCSRLGGGVALERLADDRHTLFVCEEVPDAVAAHDDELVLVVARVEVHLRLSRDVRERVGVTQEVLAGLEVSFELGVFEVEVAEGPRRLQTTLDVAPGTNRFLEQAHHAEGVLPQVRPLWGPRLVYRRLAHHHVFLIRVQLPQPLLLCRAVGSVLGVEGNRSAFPTQNSFAVADIGDSNALIVHHHRQRTRTHLDISGEPQRIASTNKLV
mmetsp:Transcript_13026/g.37709  ORF Transcript_13026/g.37709 Transcript_13026/m.37709 type:complete len:323 (+) Transcript_13026:255-1223(+)